MEWEETKAFLVSSFKLLISRLAIIVDIVSGKWILDCLIHVMTELSPVGQYVAVAAVIILTLQLLSRVFSKKRTENAPPTAKIGIPFIGNYIEFAKNPVCFLTLQLPSISC